MLRGVENSSLEAALDYEVYMQEAAGRTEDYFEGVNSFVEKREPNFLGK
jgi:2-(1,2-epoxy-1,2-dihydrophenyl)acetyl-CoA isomerase